MALFPLVDTNLSPLIINAKLIKIALNEIDLSGEKSRVIVC